ncbi:MAG TPA: tyrosine-type recombinase/integrase [Nitrospira sp.]|nr:tyrosine-type recombinase/integrase [Nitrospira sp.]
MMQSRRCRSVFQVIRAGKERYGFIPHLTFVRKSEISDLRFHDLRHTCASLLLNQGRSLKEVQEILGHRDFRMTLRYALLAKSHLVSAVNAIEDIACLPKRHESGDSSENTLTSLGEEMHTAWAHKLAQNVHHSEPTHTTS